MGLLFDNGAWVVKKEEDETKEEEDEEKVWGSNNGEVVCEGESMSISPVGIGSSDGNGGLDGFTGDLGEFFNNLFAFNLLFDVAFGDWGRHIDRDG